MNPSDLLQIAAEAASIGSNLVASLGPGTLTAKGDRDYASEVDFAVEEKVRAFLAAETPEIAFIGEEFGSVDRVERGRFWWSLDPIDGTVNFAHGLPLCAVSLALFDDDHPVVGVIDLPLLGDRYTAAEGHGAFRGENRLSCSTTDRLADAIISIGDYAVGEGSEQKNKTRLRLTEKLSRSVQRVRMFGSAAIDLVWLAEGRTDGSVTLSNSSWDIGAGVIIAREAGALVFDVDGSPHTTSSSATIAAAPGISDPLLNLVARL